MNKNCRRMRNIEFINILLRVITVTVVLSVLILYHAGPADAATAIVLPNAQGASDNTGETLSEITGDDSAVDPDTLSQADPGDNTYTVDKGNVLFIDGFNTAALSGTVSAVVLHLQYGAEDGYGGNNSVRWALDGQSLSNTTIQPTDITGWSADPTFDLFAQGVDTISEIQTLDIEFTNNDGSAADAVHFDYLWVEVTYTPSAGTVTVGAGGTQTSNMSIPSTDNYVGGYFTFIRDTGSTNVTSITVTEAGTVNANTNLSNVRLYYETACDGYQGTETLFGSTASFNASEKATVSGTMPVGTTQVCVYTVLDVGSGVSDGRTLEMEISDPSADVSVSSGSVGPSTAAAISGATTLQVPLAGTVTGGAGGTQTSNMSIPSTGNYVGGYFTFIRDTGSANVTSITVTEAGTVNATTNLSNVRLYYETACDGYQGTETLFGSAASFNASEKAAVSGTMPVGTTQVCAYTVLDVGSGASDGRTLEVEISDPSADVTVSSGSVGPSTAAAIAGTTTLNAASGDGYLLKRSQEETCHGCHKTDKNAPSDADSIKTHNSTNLSSSKWGGSWGVSGGKYGAFVCTTCHTAHDTRNILLINETITVPNGTDTWPNGSASVTVDFRVLSGNTGDPGTMGDDTGGHATSDKICEVCHSLNKYHNYDTADNTDGTSHNNALNCTAECHSHKAAFKGSGTCIDCHNARRGTIPRARITGASLGSEGDDFVRPSRHVKNSTVTNFDCIVCHAEGDAVNSSGTTIKTNTTYHGGDSGGSKTVDLRDVDNYTSVIAAWPGKRLASSTINSTNRDKMDSFCMGCHDGDTSSSTANRGGAWDIAVKGTDDGLLTGGPVARRTTPFNTGDGGSPFDVRGQFNYLNKGPSTSTPRKDWASHHNLNQFDKRYDSTYAASTPSTGFTGSSVDGVTIDWDTGLHCSDCHLNEANAHGSRYSSRVMLRASDGSDTAWTNARDGTATFVCYKCHRSDVYNKDGSPTSGVARIDHDSLDTNAWDLDATYPDQRKIVCLNCHGGGTALGDSGRGGIHGKNFSYTTPSSNTTKSYRFMNGNELWYDITDANWSNSNQPGCYTDSSSGWGSCSHHDGSSSFSSGRIGSPNYSRALE